MSTGIATGEPVGPPRVLVVGAGARFLSGVTYYTIRLSNALAKRYPVAVIPMRQLLPTRLYPGRSRVGARRPRLEFGSNVKVLASVDWYWFPSLCRALVDLIRWRPDALILEWWTGTVLHSYLALAVAARLSRTTVIIEFHEVLDTGEDRMRLARAYVNLLGPLLVHLAAGFVIHSEADRAPLQHRYRLRARPCIVIPHGPYDHNVLPADAVGPSLPVQRMAPEDTINLLFFGVIRPFKGLEDLVDAFDGLSEEEVEGFWLTVVGETWEGWDLPVRRIRASRHSLRITLVNRYVDDAEVAAYFAQADAVVLPYHRSSASGPAHIAMSHGLPLVITAVGGLPSAVERYGGALLVPPHDPLALRDAIRRLPKLRGRRYPDPHSWDRTVERYGELLARVHLPSGSPIVGGA
jgi:glycosyltransferase involved in cell wall biosynthesis